MASNSRLGGKKIRIERWGQYKIFGQTELRASAYGSELISLRYLELDKKVATGRQPSCRTFARIPLAAPAVK